MTFPCPNGHDSDEGDYCSVCGAPIPAVGRTKPGIAPPSAPRVAAAPAPSPAGAACPVCGEPRASDARFCEVCRYDFVSRKAGPPPVAAAPSAGASPPPSMAPAASAALPSPSASGPRWRLVIVVDATLDTEPDPAAPPPNEPPRVFPVEQDELLIGRRDDRQQIRPAVPLHDPGVSRRHAKVIRNQDGTLAVHDLGSANGTRVNAEDLVSGAMRSLAEGDAITMGRWTRIRVEVVR